MSIRPRGSTFRGVFFSQKAQEALFLARNIDLLEHTDTLRQKMR